MRLVYVESPFQLLQSVELLECNKNLFFIIRLNGLEKNNLQIKEIIKLFDIKNVVFFSGEHKVLLLIAVVMIFFASFFANDLYVGDDNSIVFKLIKNLISHKKIVLLDDGVATLNSQLDGNYKRYSIFSGVGESNSLSRCSRFVHSITDLRKANVIVGGKLVEEGICTQASYFGLLDDMVKSISNSCYETLYIPHRGESPENLSAIKERYGFKVVNNSLPIELIGYELSIYPCNIFSVMSTALFSMSLIYDNATVRLYPLESDKILSRKEAIENLYKIMEENSVFS